MRRLFIFFPLLFTLLSIFPLESAKACGHDGFYLGGGYMQQILTTSEKRLSAVGNSEKIVFGPAIGLHVVLGYDFCGSRWGIQMPLDWSTFRLNEEERVQMMGGAVEGVFHIASWDNGADIHLVGGVGLNLITEGAIANVSQNAGINFGVGPGFSWYFLRNKRVTANFTLDVPIRMIYFFGSRLSANKTIAISVPVRLGVTFGF